MLCLQMYKASLNVFEYRQRLWRHDAGQLARTMPELEVVRIGLLPPRSRRTFSTGTRHIAIDDALTIVELDAICQEVVDAHPSLTCFTHVVKSGGVISYTISK